MADPGRFSRPLSTNPYIELVEDTQRLTKESKEQTQAINKLEQPSFNSWLGTVTEEQIDDQDKVPFGGPSFLSEIVPREEEGSKSSEENYLPVQGMFLSTDSKGKIGPGALPQEVMNVSHAIHGFMTTEAGSDENVKHSAEIAKFLAGIGLGRALAGSNRIGGNPTELGSFGGKVIEGGVLKTEAAANKLMDNLVGALRKGTTLTPEETASIQKSVKDYAEVTKPKATFDRQATEDVLMDLVAKQDRYNPGAPPLPQMEELGRRLNLNEGYLLKDRNFELANARLTGDLSTEFQLLGEAYTTAKGATKQRISYRLNEIRTTMEEEGLTPSIANPRDTIAARAPKTEKVVTAKEVQEMRDSFVEVKGGQTTLDSLKKENKTARDYYAAVKQKGYPEDHLATANLLMQDTKRAMDLIKSIQKIEKDARDTGIPADTTGLSNLVKLTLQRIEEGKANLKKPMETPSQQPQAKARGPWNNEMLLDRLFELQEFGVTNRAKIAEILNKEFGTNLTKSSVIGKLDREGPLKGTTGERRAKLKESKEFKEKHVFRTDET